MCVPYPELYLEREYAVAPGNMPWRQVTHKGWACNKHVSVCPVAASSSSSKGEEVRGEKTRGLQAADGWLAAVLLCRCASRSSNGSTRQQVCCLAPV